MDQQTTVTDDSSHPRTRTWVQGPLGRVVASARRWWRAKAIQEIDRTEVISRIAADSVMSPRYVFMTMMSAGIAILGMLLSSPAVVIGAMLLSPLMSPLLGVGFALATGKAKWLRLSAEALGIGCAVAIGFCALIVLVSPLQTITEEIAARTKPNLFDLLIAFFSALAGSYAMIRGREGTIVGVAIATALMPPLAAIGFGLATWNWTAFAGALALFVTNVLTIALTATVMARLYGFRSSLSSRQGLFQNLGIVATFVAMAVPLGFSLRNIAEEANGQRIVAKSIRTMFGSQARISDQQIDWSSRPLAVTATVLTPKFAPGADEKLAETLTEQLGHEATVHLQQFRVGADPGAAEQAAIAQANARAQAEQTQRAAETLSSALALVAGVEPDAVVVDSQHRRMMATARELPGLDLAGYRLLERRVASRAQDWQIELRPPLLALPELPLEKDGAIGAAGQQKLAVLGWALARTGVGVELAGPPGALDVVTKALAGSNAPVTRIDRAKAHMVTARWLTP